MSLEAKIALDKIIGKARVHFYKPFQIAEILHYDRLNHFQFDITNKETYRNISKQWRDVVSLRLVGRVSTSSQKYQDNLFDTNAMPPRLLAELATINRENGGMVECYIYYQFKARLQAVIDAYMYLTTASVETFSLNNFLLQFEQVHGLKRSIDKAFEIVVYALFSTLVTELQAQVSITLANPNPQVIADFGRFVKYVLGLDANTNSVTVPASMYRGGVANAADSGLDIITNYGPAVQVKHLRLDSQLAGEIVDGVSVQDVVIVCKTAEADLIHSLLSQIGLGIRGVITQDDLENWYTKCQTRYADSMGRSLLSFLATEFVQEFPMLGQLSSFLLERGYSKEQLIGIFA